jgi:L-alanine-DL-glutamate epimerase-like enolase superfamily enzyme
MSMEQTATTERREVSARDIVVGVYRIPTDAPEADGTFAWGATTMVTVEIAAAGRIGFGYTYAHAAAAQLIRETLAPLVREQNPFDTAACWRAMTAAVRNNGDTGLCRMAIAAVDTALWDLKAKLLDLPLARLLGLARKGIPCYGSGGFTSYSVDRLQQQFGGWAQEGFGMVKMKIGSDPDADPRRMEAAREAIGPGVELYVDANEAFDTAQALRLAREFPRLGVTWYEQPVWHKDLAGMSVVRQRVPAGVAVTSGEYIFEEDWARRILEAGAVDVLQADATRCGVTGFLQVAALCAAHRVPLSSHCAPSLHLHLCCAVPGARNLEYFYDHARIEHMLFRGAAAPQDGVMQPDLDRAGLGIELDRQVAERFAV